MKFTSLHQDTKIQRIQQEVEDNLADKSDLNERLPKTTGFVTLAPKLTEMSDGDEIAYNDGTNQWLYRRIGAKLYKFQLTEV